MGPDDLLDFHNELFPEEPESELDPKDGVAAVRKKVTDYLGRGLEIEEILDLWNVAFPEARNVYYDDETDTIHCPTDPNSPTVSGRIRDGQVGPCKTGPYAAKSPSHFSSRNQSPGV